MGTYSRQFYTKKHRDLELKILCDPLSVNRVPIASDGTRPSVNEFLPIRACYDLYNLGKLEAGTTTVDISLNEGYSRDGNDTSEMPFLEVKLTRRTGGKGTPKPKVKRLLLPLYFDKGHNCIHVDLDKLSPTAHDEQGADRHALASLNRQTAEPEYRPPRKASRPLPDQNMEFTQPLAPPTGGTRSAVEPNTGKKLSTGFKARRTGSGGPPLGLLHRQTSLGPKQTNGSSLQKSMAMGLGDAAPKRVNNKRGPGGSVMGYEIDILSQAPKRPRQEDEVGLDERQL